MHLHPTPRVVPFDNVYLNATGSYLPGPPVDNDHIDQYIAPLNGQSARIRRRILAENGIRTRHYAMDTGGRTRYSVAQMGAAAARACLQGRQGQTIDLLASGTSGGDVMLPGLANELQAELGWRALATASHHGVCASGMQALANAARGVERGEYRRALVVASEFPSRLFKHTRFGRNGQGADFNAHFLRWMLSDGAGAWLLEDQPPRQRPGLRLKWVHSASYSGDFPVCMQMGSPGGAESGSWLDYPRAAAAEAAGALHLRQDIRLLPHLFDVGAHEYLALAGAGALEAARTDHFLCHYSSARFRPVVAECLQRTGHIIPESRWFTNLEYRGNTGAASIFIMLHDFLEQKRPRAGEQILLFVPESGRFTVSFALLEVTAPAEAEKPTPTASAGHDLVPPPHDPAVAADRAHPALPALLTDLAAVWHEYRARAWHTPLVRRILAGDFGRDDYLNWMAQWIPQVRQGSGWMRTAAQGLGPRYATLRATIAQHAGEEQDDYRLLFDDYRRAGGRVGDIDALRRNPGGEALHAWLSARAARGDAVESVLAAAPDARAAARSIVDCARRTAELYLMQFNDVMEAPDETPA